MATPHDLAISVDADADGDENGTADFVFRLAGDPVSLLPTTSCPLPLDYHQSSPARPLAVSNMHGAVFLAHPGGFMAVTIGALLGDSEEARCARTSCVQGCCSADLPFPGVSFLSVSTDESLIAACADSEIRFFELTALLTDKDVQPSSSIMLQQSGAIQELKWLSHASRDYALLLDDGSLSVGCVGDSPVAFMENVDAVDSCKSGSYIAAARGKWLMIISSDLKKECCITLFSQMWSSESDSEAVRIKVDFIGWVRDDSIIVGCTQLNETGDCKGYLVQVIRSDTDKFFESSSKPVLLILADCSRAVKDDTLPSGFGCGLLLGYLNHWDLILVLNKKMTKEPVSLFKWPSITGDTKTVVYLGILDDRYSPRLEQESNDSNIILGFWVEVSLFQKIPGTEEFLPQHILLSLTGEGKLIIYFLERIPDPSDLPETIISIIDDSNGNSLAEHRAETSCAQAGNRHGEGSYSEKKATYLGLQNQGATCYMNSALQVLYHIPYFRKSIYNICALGDEMQSQSIPVALQNLFYKLQYSNSKVTTSELTNSLGWSKEYLLQHQDAEEHMLAFLDKLRDSMKGTASASAVDKLFKGHYVNYINCINVDYKSVNTGSFHDLQLDVRGCRDLYASFDKYVQVARLEGEDKYKCEKFGLQLTECRCRVHGETKNVIGPWADEDCEKKQAQIENRPTRLVHPCCFDKKRMQKSLLYSKICLLFFSCI